MTNVKSCGCRYINKDLTNDFNSLYPVETEICEYLCPKHKDELIIGLFNDAIITREWNNLEEKRRKDNAEKRRKDNAIRSSL